MNIKTTIEQTKKAILSKKNTQLTNIKQIQK